MPRTTTRSRPSLLCRSTLAVALALAAGCDAEVEAPDTTPVAPKVVGPDGPTFTLDQNRSFEVGCPDGGDTCTWDERVRAAIDADPDSVRPIASPVLGVALQDGKVPAWEIKDDPSGRRYVEMESAGTDEDGTARRFSGLDTIDHWQPTAEELRALADAQRASGRGMPTTPPPTVHDPISPLLRAELATGDPMELLEVSISVRKPEGFSIPAEIQKAIGRGEVTTRGELRHARVDAVLQWQGHVASQQARVEAELTALDGRVIHRYQNLHRMDAVVPRGALESIAAHSEVTHVQPADIELTPHSVGGVARDRGSQLDQLLSNGYDGEMGAGGTDDLVAAVVELGTFGGLQRGHQGFWDTGGGSSRLVWAFDCTSGTCESHNYDWPTHDQHASGVSGTLVGDLMDGQDATFGSSTDRHQRSGVAREGRFYFYRAGSAAWDNVPVRPRHVHVVNNSWGNDNIDQQCLGQDGLSQGVNDLFLLGHLPVNSAGNCTLDDDDCDDDFGCTVNSPGSAMGSLTVGGYSPASVPENDSDAMRISGIYHDQSIGGVSWTEGRSRPIIDVNAPACYKHTYSEAATSGTDAYLSPYTMCGTSYSAPTMAGALLDFVDHYKTVAAPATTMIDDPAVMHVFATLFGDRQGGVDHGPVDLDDRLTAGFSHMWGGGRLKMRRLDAAGMDTPYSWARLSTCIDDGEFYILPLGTPSADVETVKVATYFYDPFHETGSNVAKIDAYLRAGSPYVALDYLGRNESRRLFYDEAGGKELQLLVHGQDVSGTDAAGCGANSRRVHIVWFWEDSDRDDYDDEPCWGDVGCGTYEVEPEDLYP